MKMNLRKRQTKNSLWTKLVPKVESKSELQVKTESKLKAAIKSNPTKLLWLKTRSKLELELKVAVKSRPEVKRNLIDVDANRFWISFSKLKKQIL